MLQQTNPRTLRLLDFAGFIEQLPDERITLDRWFEPCHTVACYAGHAIYKYGTPEQIATMETAFMENSPRVTAQEILGLSHQQGIQIFLNSLITKHSVVTLLRQWAFENRKSK